MLQSLPPSLGQGPRGPRGFLGGVTLSHEFETATSTPPSSGCVRLNHATPASATHVYVHDTDRNGAGLDALLDILASGDIIRLFKEADPSVFAIYQVSANSDAGAYHDLTVTYLAGAGTLEDGIEVGVGLALKGAAGADGVDAFVEVKETTDTASGSHSSTANASSGSWSSAILSHNVTVEAGDLIWICAVATARAIGGGDFRTAVVLGVAINGGTPQAVGRCSTNGLGYAIDFGISGGALFAAPGTGTYAATIHIGHDGTASPAIVGASTPDPLRLQTLVVRP